MKHLNSNSAAPAHAFRIPADPRRVRGQGHPVRPQPRVEPRGGFTLGVGPAIAAGVLAGQDRAAVLDDPR